MTTNGLYSDFFGLSERPFKLLPDPDYLFWSRIHKRAYAVLEYGMLSVSPITVVTGEVGTGKTTLIQKLLQAMDESVTVGLISNAQGGRGELLQWVLNALAITDAIGGEYVSMFQALQDYLISEYAQNRRVILVIDEAQNLSVEGLEELRMLTNINSRKDELLQLILVGQPELKQMIMRPELQQFAQRVSAFYHIPAMDREMVEEYICHRLQHAGGTGAEFNSEAIDRVYNATQGIPRMVNKLCDFSMLYAATEGRQVVTGEAVDEVLGDGIFISSFETLEDAAQ